MICARGGSKGVPNKNFRQLLGKPLIAHSIEQAKATGLFDTLAVSSDSDDILKVAEEYGVNHLVKRPDELATDTAAKIPVFKHCLLEVEKRENARFDIVVDLDATSPLRIPEDVINVVKLLEETGVANILTAAPARRSPYFNLVEVGEDEVVRLSKKLDTAITRRQDSPKCYDMNASIYAWKRNELLASESVFLKDTRLYVMPEERSIDIDSELDFQFVEFLFNKKVTISE